jgi:hypothetical protein
MVAMRPCPSCARHARVSETACPFCGARLGEAFRTFVPPRAPTTRLSRAALVAIGAAGFIAGSVDCGSGDGSASSGPGGEAGSADVTTTSMPDAAPEAGSPVDASAGDADAGATGFFYAAPDAGLATDATAEAGRAPCVTTTCPIYGIGLNCFCE